MDIAIRDTTEVDLPEIFRIRSDPLVQTNQFKLTSRDTFEAWRKQLFCDRQNADFLFKCTTVLQHNQIVGYISHTHYEIHGEQTCYCGWNLTPTCWGQGIARFAISKLFESFFVDQGIDSVISDCFSSNQRCIRLLKKLNYEPATIALEQRVRIMIVSRCFHWIRRFHLSAEKWHTTHQEAGR